MIFADLFCQNFMKNFKKPQNFRNRRKIQYFDSNCSIFIRLRIDDGLPPALLVAGAAGHTTVRPDGPIAERAVHRTGREVAVPRLGLVPARLAVVACVAFADSIRKT
jgi:hypothetical protein